ncbi:MAG: LamG domain-containing protein [Planctomycetes bacterium]|nr:LamG domain-containing protein [Planctomycetota bacterium]
MMRTPVVGSRLPLLLAVGLLGLEIAAVGQAAPAPAEQPKTAGLDTDAHLVGWWKFDEASGATAADSSKQGRNGTLQGGLSFDRDSAPGRTGKALKFDGKDGFIQITGYKGIGGTGPRTLAAWIKTKTSSGEILSWGAGDFGKMWTFGFVRGRVGVTPRGGYLYMNDTSADDAWHHVAVVVEESKTPNLHDNVKLYRDGEPAKIHDIGLLDLWPIDTGNEQDVRIGRKYNGLIDEVRLYDRALSEDEIRALFRQGEGK